MSQYLLTLTAGLYALGIVTFGVGLLIAHRGYARAKVHRGRFHPST